MYKLAINGGKMIREQPFSKHPIIGDEEKKQIRSYLTNYQNHINKLLYKLS